MTETSFEEFAASCTFYELEAFPGRTEIRFSQHAQVPTAKVDAATPAEALELALRVAKDQADEVKAAKAKETGG